MWSTTHPGKFAHVHAIPGSGTVESLPNRSVLREAIENVYNPALACSLIVVNVDNFKRCNDRFGRTTCNEILAAAGERIRSVADADIVGRVGGNFVVFRQGRTGRTLAHVIVEAARHPIPVSESLSGESTVSITVSAGVAVGPDHGSNLADLFRSAEHAVARAKHAGGDRAQCSILRSLQACEVLPASQQLAATVRELLGLLADDEPSNYSWVQDLVAAYEAARTGGRPEFIALGQLQFATPRPQALTENARCDYLGRRIEELTLVLARNASVPTQLAS